VSDPDPSGLSSPPGNQSGPAGGWGAPPPGPGPGYGQQPPGYGYGQQPPGYGYGYGQPVNHPQGTTILVLGILGLVVCGILGIFAWSMGNKAKAEMSAQPGVVFANEGQITAGRICGMISTILLGIGALFGVVVILISFAAAAGSA
jgi:hypothetical protein